MFFFSCILIDADDRKVVEYIIRQKIHGWRKSQSKAEITQKIDERQYPWSDDYEFIWGIFMYIMYANGKFPWSLQK